MKQYPNVSTSFHLMIMYHRLRGSKEEILLPKLTRKVTIKAMYDERYKYIVSNDDENIKLAIFYKICKILTSSDQGMLTSIDYVTSMFVNETCETLQNIIDKAVTNEHRDECTTYVKVAQIFMKYQFKNHVSKDDDDYCFHGFLYALSRDYINRENNNDNGCKFPFFVCDHINLNYFWLIKPDANDNKVL